jgi:ribosomal protein S18 acetylase RimI-like enzyme
VQIRAAKAPDAVALREIVERAYAIYVERIGRRPAPMDDDYAEKLREGDVFVAIDDGEVVGLIVLIAAEDHLLIENVAIDPEHQGKGIGRSLMALAETYASDRRIPELRLYTNAAMTENLVLYPRLGYRESDRRTENGLKRVFFSKRLDFTSGEPLSDGSHSCG